MRLPLFWLAVGVCVGAFRGPSRASTPALRPRALASDVAVASMEEYEAMVDYCVASDFDTSDCVAAAASMDVAAAKSLRRKRSKDLARWEEDKVPFLEYYALACVLVLVFAVDVLHAGAAAR